MKRKEEHSWKEFYNLIVRMLDKRGVFVIGILANCISMMASVLLTSRFSGLIDSFSETSSLDKEPIAITIGVLFVLQLIFGVVSVYILNYIGLKTITKVRNHLIYKITYAPMSFLNQSKKGVLASQIINDSSILMGLISSSLSECIGAIISIVFASFLLFRIDVFLTIMVIFIFLIFIIVLFPLTKKLSKISQIIQEKTALLSSFIIQTLTNIKLVKSSVSEKNVLEESDIISNQVLESGVKQVKFMALLSPIVNIILLGSILLAITVGGIRVVSNAITMGQLASFLMLLVLQILSPISTLANFITSLQSTKGALTRIIELDKMDIENLENGEEIDRNNIYQLEFENVSFKYPQTNKNVIKNISFTVKQGERIALIGPSGSGKSTIFSLIEQFYEVSEGIIKINNYNIEDYSLESLRKNIGYVTQEALLIEGTIRDNLLYGSHREISDEMLMKVCEMADIDRYIRSLDQGLNTLVGEAGANFSGGQKQRIALARVMLTNKSLVLLDEATSSLDSLSESKIQESIDLLSEGRLTLIIAHRLSTVKNATKIIFVDDGHITGIGTHHELIQSHEKYQMFYNQQFKGGE